MGERLAAAMSGGVDSSAAAFLLREQGHRVTGVTLRLAGPGDGVEDARDAARRLGIGHLVLDLSGRFREQVVDPFVLEYERGRTPNPCVECNRRIKFGALLEAAEELGLEAAATGHYAGRAYDAGAGRWLLKKAVHREKDQSYVLCRLSQRQLERSRFPLGGLSKEEVRAIALEQGFSSARRKESQDICFVPDGDYAAFLRRYTGRDYPPGPFLDREGRVLGEHRGIVCYTLGQRRGLGVSSDRGRLYVCGIDPEANAVTLSDGESLYARGLEAGEVNLIACGRLDGPVRLRARVRYRMEEQPCTVEQTGEDTVRVVFDRPQRAVTPGQTVAVYDGDTVVLGGVIEKSLREAKP